MTGPTPPVLLAAPVSGLTAATRAAAPEGDLRLSDRSPAYGCPSAGAR